LGDAIRHDYSEDTLDHGVVDGFGDAVYGSLGPFTSVNFFLQAWSTSGYRVPQSLKGRVLVETV
jgi:hypothetical protein